MSATPPDQADQKGSVKNWSAARRRQGAFSEFMARHLFLGTSAPYPIKLRLICEAGQAVTWGKDGAGQEVAESFRVLGAQNAALEMAVKYMDQERGVYSVRWRPDTIRDDAMYKEYYLDFDEEYDHWEELLLGDRLVKGSQSARERLSKRDQFILKTRYLTERGVGELRSGFYQYAQPLSMELFAEISKRVDPTVFERLLRAARGEL